MRHGDHQQQQMRQNNPMPPANPMPMQMPATQQPMPSTQPMPNPNQQMPVNQLQIVQSNDPNSNDFYAKTMPIYAAITEINPSYKQIVGSNIFEFVTKLVGTQFAPKITGMLIDLPIVEIQRYCTNFDLFAQRVQQAQN